MNHVFDDDFSKLSYSLMFFQIVSLGMPSVSPTEKVGKYVSPNEWNSLITDSDTVSLSSYFFNLKVEAYSIGVIT